MKKKGVRKIKVIGLAIFKGICNDAVKFKKEVKSIRYMFTSTNIKKFLTSGKSLDTIKQPLNLIRGYTRKVVSKKQKKLQKTNEKQGVNNDRF